MTTSEQQIELDLITKPGDPQGETAGLAACEEER